MDSTSEQSDESIGESASAMDIEFDIQFIQKKIEDLREQTVNNKTKHAKATKDEEGFMKTQDDCEAAGLANISRVEVLRSEIDSQRSRNAALEAQLEKSHRELDEVNATAERTARRLEDERRRTAEQAKKIQKELDNLNSVIFDLPYRFSREKLQAEVSAIRSESDRVQSELVDMRAELDALRDKLAEYPARDRELEGAALLAEEALRSYEESVAHQPDAAGGALHLQIMQAEAQGALEAQQELASMLGPAAVAAIASGKRYEDPTHD